MVESFCVEIWSVNELFTPQIEAENRGASFLVFHAAYDKQELVLEVCDCRVLAFLIKCCDQSLLHLVVIPNPAVLSHCALVPRHGVESMIAALHSTVPVEIKQRIVDPFALLCCRLYLEYSAAEGLAVRV